MRLLKRLISLPIILALVVINLAIGKPQYAKDAWDSWLHDEPLDPS